MITAETASEMMRRALQILTYIPDEQRYYITSNGRWRGCRICNAGEYFTDPDGIYDPHRHDCPWNYVRRARKALLDRDYRESVGIYPECELMGGMCTRDQGHETPCNGLPRRECPQLSIR